MFARAKMRFLLRVVVVIVEIQKNATKVNSSHNICCVDIKKVHSKALTHHLKRYIDFLSLLDK